MTAHGIALGLRSRYQLQAARAKAFRKYLKWFAWCEMHPLHTVDELWHRNRRLSFWTQVCLALDTEPSDVC